MLHLKNARSEIEYVDQWSKSNPRRQQRELISSQMESWLRPLVLKNLSETIFLRLGHGESLRQLRVLEGPTLLRVSGTPISTP